MPARRPICERRRGQEESIPIAWSSRSARRCRSISRVIAPPTCSWTRCPYNAHTTASDALWAGVPVLTRIGETFAGRVAASLLHAVGLPELVAETPEAYEERALALATHPEALLRLREKLAQRRSTAPLFDTASTRHLERSYLAMYRRYQAGLPPDHIGDQGE